MLTLLPPERAGDSNVPAGEVSFRVATGASRQPPPEPQLEAIGVTYSFRGEGRVASSGFSEPGYFSPLCRSLQSRSTSFMFPGGTTCVQFLVY